MKSVRSVTLACVLAALAVGCARPAPTVTPAEPDTTATTAAPAAGPAGGSGDTLDVATATGTAAYTVGNLRPVPPDAQIVPAKGSMYAVDVRITGMSGTTNVNGFYFAAGAADGSTIAPAVGAVRPGITYGQLAEGQSVEGHVAFDVAPGVSIIAVILRDPQGRQSAIWSVG